MASAPNVPHPCMNWLQDNLLETWRKFRQHADLMFDGPLRRLNATERTTYLLIWVGEKGRDIFNTFDLTPEQRKITDNVYGAFEAYVARRKNTLFSHYKFQQRSQMDRESFEDFVTDLCKMVTDCTYPNTDNMIRDRIVCGINSNKLREKLLNEGDALTLVKTLDICRTHEQTRQNISAMTDSSLNVDALHKRHQPSWQQEKKCSNCGTVHGKSDTCPARGKQCDNCHFKSVCRSKPHSYSTHPPCQRQFQYTTGRNTGRRVHAVEDDTGRRF